MQHTILERYPQLPIAVYAVWFNMYPGDARVKWSEALLTDRRVVHYWDEPRALGLRLLANLSSFLDRQAAGTLPPDADALWDTFFLYAPEDRWVGAFPRPVSWGYPIMVTKDRLARDIETFALK